MNKASLMNKVSHTLQQRQEITNYLQTLIEAHREVLSDGGDVSNLDQIRENVSICFDDLISINKRLTSHEGLLRQEIESIKGARMRILDLTTKTIKLIRSRDEWSATNIVNNITNDNNSSAVESTDVDRMMIDIHYRSAMNQYIELIGASNTSLAMQDNLSVSDTDTFIEPEKDSDLPDRLKLCKSVMYLREAQIESEKSIQSLEATLDNLKKDQKFIERELKRQNTKIQSQRDAMSKTLEHIAVTRRAIFEDLDLPMPNITPLESVTKRFLGVAIKEESVEQQIQDANDELSLTIEYIDMRVVSLASQLNEFKDESSCLLTQKEIWQKCLKEVKSLEDNLKHSLLKRNSNHLSSEFIIQAIRSTIGSLEILQRQCQTTALQSLIKNEINTLDKACGVLNREANASTSQSISKSDDSESRNVVKGDILVPENTVGSRHHEMAKEDISMSQGIHQPNRSFSTSFNTVNNSVFKQKVTYDKMD